MCLVRFPNEFKAMCPIFVDFNCLWCQAAPLKASKSSESGPCHVDQVAFAKGIRLLNCMEAFKNGHNIILSKQYKNVSISELNTTAAIMRKVFLKLLKSKLFSSEAVPSRPSAMRMLLWGLLRAGSLRWNSATISSRSNSFLQVLERLQLPTAILPVSPPDPSYLRLGTCNPAANKPAVFKNGHV